MNKKIKLLAIISFLVNIYSVYASATDSFNPAYNELDPQLYIETTAKIVPETVTDEKTNQETNAYTIIYCVDGEEISQHVFPHDNKKVKAQEIKVKYNKDEPIFWEFQKLLELDNN